MPLVKKLLLALAGFVLIAAYFLNQKVPDTLPEQWSAKILTGAMEANGLLIRVAYALGYPGGACRWTRGLVSYVLTSFNTGSPFGKGYDPELKITNTKYNNVNVRVFEPAALQGDKRPAMVYFHGGGWTWLDIDVYDSLTRELAKKVPMVVISVDYRMSPEHPHPIPFKDSLTVAKYVIENAKSLGLDPARISMGGDSAGGHLTTAVTRNLKKKVKLQVPIYPCLQMADFQTPAFIENREYLAPMLTDVTMALYWMNHGNISHDWLPLLLQNKHTSPKFKKSKFASYVSPKWYMTEYVRTENLRKMEKPVDFGDSELFSKLEQTMTDPNFSPLMDSDEELSGLPLTYVLVSGYDILRDDGLMYYTRLKSIGVEAHLAHYADGFHGMLLFAEGPVSFKVARIALDDLIDFLKKRL